MICAQVINETLDRILEKNSRVLLIGEDIEDPYGGAFKVTKGLSTRFPKQVLSTPISEQALTGFCAGLSVEGYIPVLEIMFGDFTSLIFDQVSNHLTKFRALYNFKVNPHVVIRAPMGGGRGYGPTHSQCLEKFFLGIPGLRVVSFSEFHDIQDLYEEVILDYDRPVFIAEYKNVYSRKYQDIHKHLSLKKERDFLAFSLTKFRHDNVLILTYGGTTKLCLEAAEEALYKHEIYASVISVNNLKPFDLNLLSGLVRDNMKILTIEEGSVTNGWGAYMLSIMNQNELINKHSLTVKSVGSYDYPIPGCRHLEDIVLVSKEKVVDTLLEIQ